MPGLLHCLDIRSLIIYLMTMMKKQTSIWPTMIGIIVVIGIIVLAITLSQNSSSNQYAFSAPSRGPEQTKVTVTMYSDFECPACQQLSKTIMPKLHKKYSNNVKFIYHSFPLPQHTAGQKAAYAAACASEQKKFWPYHDLLIAQYPLWINSDLFTQYGEKLKLDITRFDDCKQSQSVKKFITQSFDEGVVKKISSTPTVYINDEKIIGVDTLINYEKIINRYLNAK